VASREWEEGSEGFVLVGEKEWIDGLLLSLSSVAVLFSLVGIGLFWNDTPFAFHHRLPSIMIPDHNITPH
jgi:hypothetical protein